MCFSLSRVSSSFSQLLDTVTLMPHLRFLKNPFTFQIGGRYLREDLDLVLFHLFIFNDFAYHSQLTSWTLDSKQNVFHSHPWRTTYMLFDLFNSLFLSYHVILSISIYLLSVFVLLLSSVSCAPGEEAIVHLTFKPFSRLLPSLAFSTSLPWYFSCIYNWCVCVCLPTYLSISMTCVCAHVCTCMWKPD